MDRKSAAVAHPLDATLDKLMAEVWVGETARQTARWLSSVLGRPFPIEKVYPGHIANFIAWEKSNGE